MATLDALIQKSDAFGAHNYLPLPVVLNRGEGSYVWDVEGKKYLDFLSSYSAVNFGHQNADLLDALTSQARKLAVCSRAFMSEELCYFVEELATFCGLDKVLPMNSGTEAVETAIKLARKWGVKKKGLPQNTASIVVMKDNFHGRSITVISFSTDELYQKDFGPFTPGFEAVSFGDLDAVREAIGDNTVAVLMEPIQAEAGILIPPEGYLSDMKALCREKNVLFMLDEIQTGMGRTGRDFCFQWENATPDVLILGKSLGGGLLPLSAVVSTKEVMDVIRPGEHGSTFGGNPLACAVGRTALRMLREEKLSERSEQLGKNVLTKLQEQSFPQVSEIRGRGLLIGIDLKPSAGGARKYCEALAEKGVLCKETHEHVIRIAPPLTIEPEDLQAGVDTIIDTLKNPPKG